MMIFLHLALVLLAGVDCQPKRRVIDKLIGERQAAWDSQAPSQWENECCKEKIVGGDRYLNVGYDPTGKTMKFQCKSPCLFEKEGEAGSKYCFAAGDMRVECKDEEGGFPHESFSNSSSSLPAYNNSGYEQQGKVVDLESGLQIYVVGEPDGRPGVIWNHDIRGFNGGRTRERCDELAAQGFMVILPDYFIEKPEECGPGDFACWAALVPVMAANTNWTRLEADWTLVRSWAEEKGVTTFAAVGTCWGSYMTLRMSSLPEVVAGVSIHPSHSVMIPQMGEDEAEILGQVEAPQLFLPTMTDSDNVKPGGLGETVLAEKGLEVSVVPFLTMRHGFLTRGDISDPDVAAEVSRAMNVTVDFIEKQFGNQ